MADAFRSIKDTFGLGIGYGTESVRWRYEFVDMPVFTFLPDARLMSTDRMLQALSTGVENSFVQVFLRTGACGFVLFVAAFFAAFPSPELPQDVRNHAAVIFAMMFLACFVNSTLESPVSAIGPAFLYGYLIALRGGARTPSIRESTVVLPTRLNGYANARAAGP